MEVLELSTEQPPWSHCKGPRQMLALQMLVVNGAFQGLRGSPALGLVPGTSGAVRQ